MTQIQQNKIVNELLDQIPGPARFKILSALANRFGSNSVKNYRRRLLRSMLTEMEIGEILLACKNAGFTPEGMEEAKRIAQEQLSKVF